MGGKRKNQRIPTNKVVPINYPALTELLTYLYHFQNSTLYNYIVDEMIIKWHLCKWEKPFNN